MLVAARRLGASIILLAVVYQGRSAWSRPAAASEARRALAEVMQTDCTSAMQDGCCKSQESCGSDWQPVCGSLPSTPTWRYGVGVATNFTGDYTFISVIAPPPSRARARARAPALTLAPSSKGR